MTGELIGPPLRHAVRDQVSGTILRDIANMWEDEGFPTPTGEIEPVGGERVTLFQQYLNQVNWQDSNQVRRAICVFEQALKPLFAADDDTFQNKAEQIDRLRRLFVRDGYNLSEQGCITPLQRGGILQPEHLDQLSDANAILEHLDRIDKALATEDAPLVIGSAKELIETTAKFVLHETGSPFEEGNDLPGLIQLAEHALHVHPQQANPGPDGSQTVRKTLGAAHTIAQNVAELRNNYGTGHGRSTRPSGLTIRHARLAVNAARLWCQFMLDTLNDPRSPWRTKPSEPKA